MSQTNPLTGFPSQFVDPEIKKTPAYCKKYAEAFDGDCKANPADTGFIMGAKDPIRWRKLARGEQDPNAYKEQMTLKSEDGRPNTSFRNLSWQIVKIAPKLRNVLISKVVNHDYRMNVRTIDPMSMSRKRLEKSKIQEFITNQDAIAEFEKYSKMKLERPLPEDDMSDINPQSIDTYLNMNPKDMTAMEVKDLLTYNLVMNNWAQKSDAATGDMVDIAKGAIHVFVDDANAIKLERWIPERVVTNRCLENDYSDMIRVGYYNDITVSEIKRKTKGSLGEEAYKDMANKASGENKYTDSCSRYFSESSYAYAYDHEKVKIFQCYWFSTDTFTYMEHQNGSGNRRMKKEAFNYTPFKGDMSVNEGKGMSDDQFHEYSGGTKTIFRNEIRNVYRCTWVMGTDYVYDYGLMTNMQRAANAIADTKLPVAMYTTDGMSSIGNIETLLDQFQLNWLQFQAHTASSKPPGIAIEKNALVRAAMGPGQSGKKVDWKKLLQMYAESGNIVYDGLDPNGNPYPQHPFVELKNGLSEGAVKHLDIMITMLDFIRTVLGINALTEGEAPAPRIGKAVAEMSFGATQDALAYLNKGYKSLYEQTCKLILGLIPDTVEKGQLPGMQEALGMETMRFLDLNKDLGLLEMGIYIEEGPDDLIRQRISDAIAESIKKDQLDAEDAVYIELEENPYRAIQYLRIKKKKKAREKQAMDQQNIQLQAQENGKIEQMKIQAQQDAEEKSWDREQKKQVLLHTLTNQNEQEAFMRQVIIMKLENKLALSAEQEEFINKRALALAEIREQGKIDKDIARINAKNRSLAKSK
jgi:hypothetical protein